jgi:hypothetical protein
MPIRSVSFYTYRTSGRGWTAPQIGVLRFVRAIKKQPLAAKPGGPDSGYLLVNGTEPKRLLRPKNANEAFDWYAEMATKWIRTELGTMRVVLVPIPNSDCTQLVAASRTRALADAIIEHVSAPIVADVLRWRHVMVPAHRGGPRTPELLYPELRLKPPNWTPTVRPHVLIDDVSTSGGHIRACAALLVSRGANVALAISGAQAEQLFTGDPYGPRITDHPDFDIP